MVKEKTAAKKAAEEERERQFEELKKQYPEFENEIEIFKQWYSPEELKEEIEWHIEMLYPTGMVKVPGKGGGSGTVIYSKPNPEKPEEWLNFAITNWHVVEKSVSWEGDESNGLNHEVLDEVTFNLFDYTNLSRVISSNEHKAVVIDYDKYEDIAVLQIKTPKKIPYVAKLIEKKDILKILRPVEVYVVGCTLLHNPFHTSGEISYINESMQNKEFLMYNANSYFGVSGGVAYLKKTREMIGIPARVTVVDLGFGADVVSWMGFCIPPERIYDFFEKKGLLFLVDDNHTYKEYLENKEERKKSWKMNRK